MFEVGKKYYVALCPKNVAECVMVDNFGAVLKWVERVRDDSDRTMIGDLFLRPHTFLNAPAIFEKVKEPIKIVRYVNCYPMDQVSRTYKTRDDADAVGDGRIACKRIEIEFTEGEYDA